MFRKPVRMLLLFVLVLGLNACKEETDTTIDDTGTPLPDAVVGDADIGAADVPIDQVIPPDVTPDNVIPPPDNIEPDIQSSLCKTHGDCAYLLDGQEDNPCVIAYCDMASQTCVKKDQPNGLACDPGDKCVEKAQCQAGECVGMVVVCDDGNVCTTDACDSKTGCVFDPNTEPCNDGNMCTPEDVCEGGVCIGKGNDCPCETDEQCPVPIGGDLCQGKLVCAEGVCVLNPASVVVCEPPASTCIEVACNPATGLCEEKVLTDGSGCDDGTLCTVGDLCVGGQCKGGQAMVCDDQNVCTIDSCDPAKGCVFTVTEMDCDDGNGCTTGDKCVEGVCTGAGGDNCKCGSDEDCGVFDDGNACNGLVICKQGMCMVDPLTIVDCAGEDVGPCAKPVCNPESGKCEGEPVEDGLECDDKDPCTLESACDAGECVGTSDNACDDQNPCTADACDSETGCKHTPTDGPCDDKSVCTEDDVCKEGVCVGEALPCDDQNPCTANECDPVQGCIYPADDQAACDDGDACTAVDKCYEGACVGTESLPCDDQNPCTADSCNPEVGECVTEAIPGSCDDQNPCTPEDLCDNGLCVGTGIVPCDDGNACTDDTCDPTVGCKYENNVGACEDGDPCTENDVCAEGVCQPGQPLACDDKNVCTDDSCEALVGCVYVANSESCDDDDACTLADTCVAGECIGTEALSCDDQNECTDNTCDVTTGCQFPNNTAACDDGDTCTTKDTCLNGKCEGGPELGCDDGNPCTDDGCDSLAGCTHTNNTAACDDGSKCTDGDVCKDGVCVGGQAIPCDDQNGCTADSCDPATGCVFTNTTLPCDDADACTANDTCTEGACKGTPIVCDDKNLCTDDSCAAATGCVFAPNELPCDDNNKCTEEDKCGGGQCLPGKPLDCDDENVCTSDTCIPQLGCFSVANNNNCDDGDPCTSGDLCKDKQCKPGNLVACNDFNACTTDTCEAGVGCVFKPVADETACDDGNSCTLDDKCSGGFCKGLGQDCDDFNPCTDNKCDPEAGCYYKPNTLDCDDSNVCTLDDKCTAGQCKGMGSLACDDGNDCTDDFCDPAKGCVHVNNTAKCEDGNACTTGDTCSGGVCVGGPALFCDDGNLCTDDSCAPETGCVYTPNTVACDDNNKCTTNDACNGGVCTGGVAPKCDDGNVCTDDSCEPAVGCVHVNNVAQCSDGNACTTADTCAGGVCVGGPAPNCDDKNVCTTDTCDPGKGCVNTNNTLACDDGNKCTTNDKCGGGVCVGGAAPNCDDKNVCTTDTCDPAKGCINSNNTLPCDDGNKCTKDDTCAAGACKGATVTCNDDNVCTDDSCNPAVGCVFTPNTLACDDKNICTKGDKCSAGKCVGGPLDTCDDKNVCTTDACIPGFGCVQLPNTMPCDDKNPCTTNDICANSVCVGGPATNCDDANPCTVDSCDKLSGCVHKAGNDGASCNDGNDCTSNDKCAAGVCKGVGTQCPDDGEVCTTEKCNPITGCYPEYNTLPCDDKNICTVGDKCNKGTCLGGPSMNCDDGNVCTNDFCDPGTPGGCVHVPNTAACDDKNACTTKDVCSGGVCVGSVPPNCDDKNVCTNDSCDPTIGCKNDANTLPCDDGNKCTTNDTCSAKVCKGGPAPNCDDKNVCTNDSCDPTIGCKNDANTLPCDDGNKCTTNDTCSAKACKGGPALNCDDGNVCTNDSCNPTTGCVNAFNTLPCNDASECTLNDTCKDGKCVGTQKNCQDTNPCTDDLCDPKLAGGCYYTPNANPCDDLSKCTDKDTCSAGSCKGTPVTCDDKNVCTDDSCDPNTGCVFTANNAPCDDANPCTENDICAAKSCAGTAKVCNDYNSCTNDSCDPATGNCVYALSAACPTKKIPIYDDLDDDYVAPCTGLGWTLSPAIGGVAWALDATPNPPGKLTYSCSLNYNNGTNLGPDVASSGTAITTFLFDATAAAGAMTLAFHSYNGTEEPGEDYDVRTAEISTDGFNTIAWSSGALPNGANKGVWVLEAFDISTLKGKKFQLRFKLDTKDGGWNNGKGWFVEDVNIYAGPIVQVHKTATYTEPFAAGNVNGWQMFHGIGNGPVVWAIDATAADPGKFEGDASLNFNDGTDYANGASQVTGNALSPVLDLTQLAAGTKASVLIRSWHDVETSNSYDFRIAEASDLAFTGAWTNKKFDNVSGGKGWKFEWLDLSSYVGKKIRVRFRFDSFDGMVNTGKGWFIDYAVMAARAIPDFGNGLVCSDQAGWTTQPAGVPTVGNPRFAVDAIPAVPGFYSSDCSLNCNDNSTNFFQAPVGTTWTATSTSFSLTLQAGMKNYISFRSFFDMLSATPNTWFSAYATVYSAANPAKQVTFTIPATKTFTFNDVDISTLGTLVDATVRFTVSCAGSVIGSCINNTGYYGLYVDDVLIQSRW